jgi:mRNA-degrading endonuclease RelE of RelBE toxin-antitoxin system
MSWGINNMTMPYVIQIAPPARRQIIELETKHQKIVIKVIEALMVNPRPPGVNRVEGMTGLYCQVIEAYRIIYKIDEQTVIILVIKL